MTPDQVAAYIDNHVAATTPLYPAEDIVENKMTDNESSEEVALPVDESDIGSSDIKVVMINNEDNLNEMKAYLPIAIVLCNLPIGSFANINIAK